ncbi:MAG TPA: SPFH domain-containing protein [Mycobacteriales bacterium]|nr:SPFH domain-containing protein [Mycobacteriales bacterium]
MTAAIVAAVIVVLLLIVLSRAVRIVPQASNSIVERLGRYNRTMQPGLHLVVPFLDRVRRGIDLREQVVSFPPQSVITKDNLVVGIDSVIYYQVTDPFRATYEIANPVAAIEQLSVTTLRNVTGGLQLEEALTSRDHINAQLSSTLDEATGKWGIKVNRVEIKAIEPPPSIRDAMEQAMRADRQKRATILTAEGEQQSAILTAQGQQQAVILQAEAAKRSTILAAEGEKEAAVLRADGEAEAIKRVVASIKEAGVDPQVLAYQQLQMLPSIANGEASKVWFVPTDVVDSLRSITGNANAAAAAPAPTTRSRGSSSTS